MTTEMHVHKSRIRLPTFSEKKEEDFHLWSKDINVALLVLGSIETMTYRSMQTITDKKVLSIIMSTFRDILQNAYRTMTKQLQTGKSWKAAALENS